LTSARRRSIVRSVAPLPIAGAGHFIQEDRGEEMAARILEWMTK
jgi:hypothetical protein